MRKRCRSYPPVGRRSSPRHSPFRHKLHRHLRFTPMLCESKGFHESSSHACRNRQQNAESEIQSVTEKGVRSKFKFAWVVWLESCTPKSAEYTSRDGQGQHAIVGSTNGNFDHRGVVSVKGPWDEYLKNLNYSIYCIMRNLLAIWRR